MASKEQIDILLKMSADVEALKKARVEGQRLRDGLVKQVGDIGKSFRGLFALAGIGGLAEGLRRIGANAIAMGRDLRTSAAQMNLSTTELQVLSFAARESGTSVEAMRDAIGTSGPAFDAWAAKIRAAGQFLDQDLIDRLAVAEASLESFRARLTVLAAQGLDKLAAAGTGLGIALGSAFYGVDAAADALLELDSNTKTATGSFKAMAAAAREAEAAARGFDILFQKVADAETALRDFGISDAERLSRAQAQLVELQAAYQAIPMGQEPDRTGARLRVLQQELEVKRLIASVDAASRREWETFEGRAQALDERKADFELRLLPVQEQRARITRELIALEAALAEAGEMGAEARLALEEKQLALRERLQSLQADSAPGAVGRDPMAEMGQRMADLQNPQLVVLAAMEGMFESINEQVQGLIDGTITWGDALRNVGGSIVSAVISQLAQMAAAAITSYILTAVGIQAISATVGAQTMAMGAAASAAWIPAAIAASIATMGAAAGVGAAAFAMAMLSGAAVATVAAGLAGFGMAAMGGLGQAAGQGMATGGPVRGPGGPRDDLVPARLSNGEYVVNALAAGYYGQGMLDDINSLRAPRGGLAAAAVAGPAGGSAGSRRPVQVVFSDNRKIAEQMKRDPSVETIVLDMVRRNRARLAL